MFLLFELIWFASLSFTGTVSGYALQRRVPCPCPPFDAGNFLLSTRSGIVGGMLRCIYLDTSRCLYSPMNGSLLLDSNFGSCPPTARGGRCPAFDLAQDSLGRGSTVFNSTLYCTYPRPLELLDTSFFCEYKVEGGALMRDSNEGCCPPTSSCDDERTSAIATQRRVTRTTSPPVQTPVAATLSSSRPPSLRTTVTG